MKNIIRQIRNAITGTEFEGKTYIAGGFVRDQVLGLKNNDLDITVELPEGGIRLAGYLFEKGLASKPVLYQEFGTALTIMGDYKIEFVMTLNESYRKGCRKPATNSGTIYEDICRRDFTINSLIMDIMTGEIYDLSGKGMADIKAGIIRSTSEPDIIFNDDPLRILRAVRFANRFDYTIEENTLKGIFKDCGELVNISWERKRDEFEKILISPSAQNGLKMLFDFGLMEYLIPELVNVKDDICFNSIIALPEITEPRLAILLAVLVQNGNNDALIKTIISRLKFSNRILQNCLLLLHFLEIVNNLINTKNYDDLALRKFYYQHKELYPEYLSYLSTHFTCIEKESEFESAEIRALQVIHEIGGKKYPLNGTILKEQFYLPEGKELGQVVNYGLEIWLRMPERNRDELLLIIKEKYSY